MRVRASLFYLGLGRLEEEVARCYTEYRGTDRSCSMEKYTVYSEEKDFPARQCVPEIESVSRPLKGGDIARLDSPTAKLVTRKVWQSGESRKTLSGTRGRASELAYVYSDPRKIPGISRRGGTSWQHVLGIELLSMSMQLQRRLSFKTCRCDVSGRERESRPRSLFPALPAKISHQTSAYFIEIPKCKSKIFPGESFTDEEKRGLKVLERRKISRFYRLSNFWSIRGVSAIEKKKK